MRGEFAGGEIAEEQALVGSHKVAGSVDPRDYAAHEGQCLRAGRPGCEIVAPQTSANNVEPPEAVEVGIVDGTLTEFQSSLVDHGSSKRMV